MRFYRNLHGKVLTLTLFNTTLDDGDPDHVEVHESEVGLGVYASRPYPKNSVIGEITGEMFADPYPGTSYTFEANEGFQLEPFAPFRYLNHSCRPNCEFNWIETPASEGQAAHAGLFLSALRPIFTDEQFTIDYRWPASCAIQCQCKEALCRGWIVDETQLDLLPNAPTRT